MIARTGTVLQRGEHSDVDQRGDDANDDVKAPVEAEQELYVNEPDTAEQLREIARHGTMQAKPSQNGGTVAQETTATRAPTDTSEQEVYENFDPLLQDTPAQHSSQSARSRRTKRPQHESTDATTTTGSHSAKQRISQTSTESRSSQSQRRKAAAQSGTYGNQEIVDQFYNITDATHVDETQATHGAARQTSHAAQSPSRRAKPAVAQKKPTFNKAKPHASAKSNIATRQARHETTTVDNAAEDEDTYVAPDQATANPIGDNDDLYLSPDQASANQNAGEDDNVYLAPDQTASSESAAADQDTYTPMHAVSGGASIQERLAAALSQRSAVTGRANRGFDDEGQQIYANT